MQQAKRFLRIAGWTLWMAMGVVVSAHWVNAKSPEQAVILKGLLHNNIYKCELSKDSYPQFKHVGEVECNSSCRGRGEL